MGLLTAEQKLRISEALGDLIAETAYEEIDLDSQIAVSVSLIRAECVRLARALQRSGTDSPNISRWLADAAVDPLPEVRFVLDN